MNITNIPIHKRTYSIICRLYEDEEVKTLKLSKKDNFLEELSKYSFSRIKITQIDRFNHILTTNEQCEGYYSLSVRNRFKGRVLSIVTSTYTDSNFVLSFTGYEHNKNADITRKFSWIEKGIFTSDTIIKNGKDEDIRSLITSVNDKEQFTTINSFKNGEELPERMYKRKKFVKNYMRSGNVLKYQLEDVEITWKIPENKEDYPDCEYRVI